MKQKKFLREYWMKHYTCDEHTLCTLCGNTGIIDTRYNLRSPTGMLVKGKVNCCICPNGRALNPEDN